MEEKIEFNDDVLSGKRNRRNGYNKKTIKGTSDGSFELETPRDRNGSFVLTSFRDCRFAQMNPK